MSKQTINLGTAPTGVGGDTPRSAFTKTQSNFDELYTALGAAGSPATLPAALPITKGGTGGNTQAAARTALGLKSAALADIVGAVAQDGGVPTGSIIERGSNANGEYAKFADGTLYCWIRVFTVSYIASNYMGGNWTYPSAFVEFPAILTGQPAVVPAFKFNRGVPGASGDLSYAAVRIFATGTDTYAAGETANLQILAIGRWYV